VLATTLAFQPAIDASLMRAGFLKDTEAVAAAVDDLAMVLQVLSRCGGQPLAAACQQALDLAFAAAGRGEAVSTWILDPEQAPHRNQVFRRYIELTQADGVHPDVVANLLYAVSLQATETARPRAASAIAYLESAQGDDGSWDSRWYWGKHYGTYRAVLALAALTPASRALDRARLPLHRFPPGGRTRNPYLSQQHHNDKLLPQGHFGRPGSALHRPHKQAAGHTRLVLPARS